MAKNLLLALLAFSVIYFGFQANPNLNPIQKANAAESKNTFSTSNTAFNPRISFTNCQTLNTNGGGSKTVTTRKDDEDKGSFEVGKKSLSCEQSGQVMVSAALYQSDAADKKSGDFVGLEVKCCTMTFSNVYH